SKLDPPRYREEMTYSDIFTSKIVISYTGRNANRVPYSGCHARRVDMVVVVKQPELEAVFPPGSWGVLQGDTGRQVLGVTLLRRPEHRELGSTAVIREGFTVAVSIAQDPAQLYGIGEMDTAIGLQCCAQKTVAFDGSTVIQVRTTHGIVQHAQGAVGLEQRAVRIETPCRDLHTT